MGCAPVALDEEESLEERSEVIINAELLQALNYVINEWHPVRLPGPAPTYLDALLARDLLVGNPMIYDDRNVLVISVMGYPQGSYQIIHSLSLLPFEIRCKQPVHLHGFPGRERVSDLAAQALVAEDAELFRSDIQPHRRPDQHGRGPIWSPISMTRPLRSTRGYLLRTPYLRRARRGPDVRELEERAREVVKAFEFTGFPARIEKRNGMEAF